MTERGGLIKASLITKHCRKEAEQDSSGSSGDNQPIAIPRVALVFIQLSHLAQAPPGGSEWQIKPQRCNSAQPPVSVNIMEAFNYASNYTGC